jgi:hypothetical protein
MNEDILLPIELPAEALKLAWRQMSLLQAVNDRFTHSITRRGKSGRSACHPTEAVPTSIANSRYGA